MNTPKPPMLAAAVADTTQLFEHGPLLASPKIDGVRALIYNTGVWTRSLKLVPNRYVQDLFGCSELNCFDGELVVGPPTGPDVMRSTTSGVMRVSGEPLVVFHVFDVVTDLRYEERLTLLKRLLHRAKDLPVNLVPQRWVHNESQLLEAEREWLDQGYEGVMLRDPSSMYKHGRSTWRERGLLKLKRFVDGEAEVIELLPAQRNDNPAKVNALGHTERSSHKENKTTLQTVGSIHAKDLHTGQEVFIGPGRMLAEQRKRWWQIRKQFVGRIAHYRYFPTGTIDAPRFPVWYGWRDSRDL